ncbi:hypothetical protein SCOCK_100223 [Actinacidiphila cocklensis]|uniref:Uncharacterized protein n=1 Tax=Actinacidiphila cocklensis TaxID=887465 RepID=A0A9W4E1Y4_9ACTN|nr:hypothetical protein SCOCK_100223 [Actinacidiphila cocklensis]
MASMAISNDLYRLNVCVCFMEHSLSDGPGRELIAQLSGATDTARLRHGRPTSTRPGPPTCER